MALSDPATLLVSIIGGHAGSWSVERTLALRGASLDPVARVAMVEGPVGRGSAHKESWVLQGVTGHDHYLVAEERQDARRAIFEERSHHIARSLAYIPRIARRLHHSRDLGEPFDFLTWFEFAPSDAAAFDELTGLLRETEEWTYVEREVEIRLTSADKADSSRMLL